MLDDTMEPLFFLGVIMCFVYVADCFHSWEICVEVFKSKVSDVCNLFSNDFAKNSASVCVCVCVSACVYREMQGERQKTKTKQVWQTLTTGQFTLIKGLSVFIFTYSVD